MIFCCSLVCTFSEETLPLVFACSLEVFCFNSMVIERVFDLESWLLIDDDEGVSIVLVGVDVFEFWARNFEALKRRRTEPKRELSVCRSDVLVE